MNWAALRLLFIHEMRMVLRSRRTIVTSLVLPAVLMPIMILGARYVQREQTIRLDQTTFRYAITGPWPDQVRRLIDRYKTAAEFRNFQIEEVQPTDPDRALDDRTLHFYIRTMTVEDADKAAAAATNDEGSEPPDLNTQSLPRIEGVPGLQVVYRGSQQIARLGAERMVDMMRAARRNESYSIMLSRGFPSHPEGILALTATNVATEAQVSGSNLGRFFTVVLVVWLVAAGAIVDDQGRDRQPTSSRATIFPGVAMKTYDVPPLPRASTVLVHGPPEHGRDAHRQLTRRRRPRPRRP